MVSGIWISLTFMILRLFLWSRAQFVGLKSEKDGQLYDEDHWYLMIVPTAFSSRADHIRTGVQFTCSDAKKSINSSSG